MVELGDNWQAKRYWHSIGQPCIRSRLHPKHRQRWMLSSGGLEEVTQQSAGTSMRGGTRWQLARREVLACSVA